MSTSKRIAVSLVIVVIFSGVGLANWADSFDGGKLNLAWQFPACPEVTGTYKGTAMTAADGNGYLVLNETTAYDTGAGQYGAAFGAGFGTNDKFKDVCIGATVNATGDACHNYYGLLARAAYIIDPDGKLSGVAPGFWATCYIMHIDYSRGPANLALDLEKVLNNQNVMDEDIGVVIPLLENARSYYAELEVVGAGPVYVTGRLYEFKGGPLIAQTPTMVDTDAKDAWEDAGKREKILTEGVSGIFAQNEDAVPVGFTTTWDDVSSTDSPKAVLLSPADGATDVSMKATLSWVEAKFATGRQLWFGTPGNLAMVDPAPIGASYTTGMLVAAQTYEWRVDQVGPAGTVTGQTWRFTTGNGLAIDDFESYADSAAIAAAWPHNIPGYDYIFLDTANIRQGAKAMRFTFQNGADPFVTEATRTFATAQDWTVENPTLLSMDFRGEDDNVEQPMYVIVEDEAGNKATVNQVAYAVQSETWRVWDIPLADFAGVNMAAVKKLSIGTGSGSDSGQASGDEDTLYIDNVRLTFGQ